MDSLTRSTRLRSAYRSVALAPNSMADMSQLPSGSDLRAAGDPETGARNILSLMELVDRNPEQFLDGDGNVVKNVSNIAVGLASIGNARASRPRLRSSAVLRQAGRDVHNSVRPHEQSPASCL